MRHKASNETDTINIAESITNTAIEGNLYTVEKSTSVGPIYYKLTYSARLLVDLEM